MYPLQCRRCGETPMFNGIVTIRDGKADETSPMCEACVAENMADEHDRDETDNIDNVASPPPTDPREARPRKGETLH